MFRRVHLHVSVTTTITTYITGWQNKAYNTSS